MAIFSPQNRDTRGAETLCSNPHRQWEKSRRPSPDALVPHSLVPCPLLSPQRTDFRGMAHIDAAGRVAADGDCSEAAAWWPMLGPVPRLEPKLEPGLATGTGVSVGSSCMRVRQAVSRWMD